MDANLCYQKQKKKLREDVLHFKGFSCRTVVMPNFVMFKKSLCAVIFGSYICD